jgi:riboflavin biosynthesis pyrimidine reductase
MSPTIWQLYPPPAAQLPLPGLYLGHNLRQESERLGRPLIYANFITSLDGRIAVQHPTRPGLTVPKQIANDRDWRLFQELAIQADVIITTGRYLRDYAGGRAQEILTVHEDPRYADLQSWRAAQGLPPQPDLAVLSNSLDFPIPPALDRANRRVLIITNAQADPARVAALQAQSDGVIVAGEQRVEGLRLRQALAQRGYHTIYSAAGPKVLHTLATAGVLDRLFLTFAARLLAGHTFATFLDGPPLTPPLDLRLHTLYLDEAALDGAGQLFASYLRPPEQAQGTP